MSKVSNSRHEVDYFSLLKSELAEIGSISIDPSMNMYQKEAEQALLEEEYGIRFSKNAGIPKLLSELDMKGLRRRYHSGIITMQEYKDGMELAREADKILVPKPHRNCGGKSGMKNIIRDENAIAIMGYNFGDKPATTEGEAGKMEKKGIVGGIIDWAGRHPYLSAFGLITLFAGGVAANEYRNNKKFANENDIDSGIAKAKAQISAGASGMFAAAGDLFKGNQPPVANNTENKAPFAKIKFDRKDLNGGNAIKFDASGSYDPDGKIVKYKWSFQKVDGIKEAEVTPTPFIEKKLEGGLYKVTLDAEDDKGKIGSTEIGVNVEGGPHKFTPDLKVFGSDVYKRRVQNRLDELNKTPDSFRINGMTAYEYATYWTDELHEGPEGNCDTPATGCERMPMNIISLPSNLIHIPRHTEQGQNQTMLKQSEEWRKRYPKDSPGLFHEHDAIKLQVSWEKARYNLTDEQAIDRFNLYMKQYTNDPKYFAKSFPPKLE